MTFQSGTGFTQIITDSGTATISAAKPNLSIVGANQTSTSASGNVITVNTDTRLKLVDSVNVSPSVSEVVLTTTAAEPHLIVIQDYNPSTNATFLSMEASANGGSTWVTSGYQTSVRYWAWNSTTMTNQTSTFNYRLSGPVRNDRSASFILWLGNVNIGAQLNLTGESTWHDTTLGAPVKGLNMGDTPIPPSGYDAFRFFSSSGNISNGRFRLYSFS